MDQNSERGVCSCDCGTCETPNDKHCSRCGKCKCPHHKVVPGMVALIAIVFLLGAFDVVSARFVQVAWPVLLLIAAGTKTFERKCTCC